MHPRIQELLDYLAHHRADLRAAVDSVPADLRDRRPAPERWSVAEVVEHLAIVEGRITDGFIKQVAAARAKGLGPDTETAPVVPALDVAFVLDRTNRLIAAEVARPRGESDSRAAWAALERSRERLRAALVDADGLALGRVRTMHPVLGEMGLYQLIAFVGAHEGRHAAQVREIGGEVEGTSSASGR
ncbi:MAG TPA: DinB family protein [Gemmatimonadaceae bacterium]|nr:DinB family protein [Gemmatimonadaceae bacterium]